MRVIAGSARGRRLTAPRGRAVRPTADRVKEALFSMLGSRAALDGTAVLDLFAGSGALGIEALSRGAGSACFVEPDRTARAALADNLARCGLGDRARVIAAPVAVALRRLAAAGARFDRVLLDPPYGRGLADEALTALAALELVRPEGWVVVEHHVEDVLLPHYGDLRLTTAKRYGKTAVALYASEPAPTG